MKRILTISLMMVGCGGPQRPAESGGAPQGKADGSAPAVLLFDRGGAVKQAGVLAPGGALQIAYDLERLPKCRAGNWSATARYAVDGGAPRAISLRGPAGEPWNPTFNLPLGQDLALWFENSDADGCADVDSQNGRNYHFTIEPVSAPVLHFGADWSVKTDGRLAPGSDLLVDYDLDRLPACRGTYNGRAAWSILAYWRFDGGEVTRGVVTQTVDYSEQWASLLRITAPTGARELEMWFENSDISSCTGWDSDWGRNFHFALR